MGLRTHFNSVLTICDFAASNAYELDAEIYKIEDRLKQIEKHISMMVMADAKDIIDNDDDIITGVSYRISEMLEEYADYSVRLHSLNLYKEEIKQGKAKYYSYEGID